MSEPLPYPLEVFYKEIVFKYDGELGAGAFGIVYRYKSARNIIAVKIEEESKRR